MWRQSQFLTDTVKIFHAQCQRCVSNNIFMSVCAFMGVLVLKWGIVSWNIGTLLFVVRYFKSAENGSRTSCCIYCWKTPQIINFQFITDKIYKIVPLFKTSTWTWFVLRDCLPIVAQPSHLNSIQTGPVNMPCVNVSLESDRREMRVLFASVGSLQIF